MIKKFLVTIIFASVLYSCGENKTTEKKNEKIVAVSTITVINDIVKNIGKDKIEA